MPQPANFDLPEHTAVDSLYPRDGQEFEGDSYFDQPAERTEIEREEKNAEYESVPFLKSIHTWFDENIASADSIDNIDMQSATINGVTYHPPTSTDAQILAYKMFKQLLEEKKATFPTLEELDS